MRNDVAPTLDAAPFASPWKVPLTALGMNVNDVPTAGVNPEATITLSIGLALRSMTPPAVSWLKLMLLLGATLKVDPAAKVTFPVAVPHNFSEAEVLALLERQGYTRIHSRSEKLLHVVQDRFRLSNVERARAIEAIEAALRVGQGRVDVHPAGASQRILVRETNGSSEPAGCRIGRVDGLHVGLRSD